MFRFSGTKLKAARLAAGFSQRRLAQQLGIANTSLGAWERNIAKPTAGKLPQIAEILGVEIKDLFEEVPDDGANQ